MQLTSTADKSSMTCTVWPAGESPGLTTTCFIWKYGSRQLRPAFYEMRLVQNGRNRTVRKFWKQNHACCPLYRIDRLRGRLLWEGYISYQLGQFHNGRLAKLSDLRSSNLATEVVEREETITWISTMAAVKTTTIPRLDVLSVIFAIFRTVPPRR